MGQGIVAGANGTAPHTIDAFQDASGNWRLRVEALLSGVAENEVDLDHETDSVQIYGNDGTTNRAVLTDAAGRVKTDSTLQIADVDVGSGAAAVPIQDGGNIITVDGTVTIQDGGNVITVDGTVTADQGAPASTANRWPVQITDGTDLALVTAAGEVNVLATAQPGTDIGDVTINNASGASAVNIQDGGNVITVDATNLDIRDLTSASDSVAVVGNVADGSAASGNPVQIAGSDGTNVQRVRTDTTGNQGVYHKTLSGAHADNLSATQSFRVAEDGSLLVDVSFPRVYDAASNNFDLMRGNTNGTIVQGAAAHDAVGAGNPIYNGFAAIAHGTNPTEVAAGDITAGYATRAGQQIVIGGHPNVQTSQYISTGTITDDNLLPAIATGTKYVITRVTVTVDEATTVGVGFRLGFGTASVPAAPATNADAVAGILLTHAGLVPGGGITIGDGSGILGVGGDGEELRVTVSDAPTSGSIHFNVTWYTIAS